MPALLALATGCATHQLWTNEQLEACRQPADKLNLQLFQSSPATNLLVVYDEIAERNEAVRTRAYWLNENENLIRQNKRPHFVNVKSSDHLAAVPVFCRPLSSGAKLPDLYAVAGTNKQSFTLYRAGAAVALYDLPVYNDGKGRVERIALTPITVTADATVIGGVIGYMFLVDYAGGSVDWSKLPPFWFDHSQ